MKRGKFIVFEGLDGAGTTTQLDLLYSYLKKQGYRVVVTKSPTDNIIGGLIRGSLTKHWKTTPACLQLLFAADRSNDLQTRIMPALEKGAVVLCDRYVLSTLAYGGLDLDPVWLRTINSKFPKPDLTIFIDTSPRECIERLKKDRFSLELFEDEKKLRRVRDNYLKYLRDHQNYIKVDGSKSITTVFSEIKKKVAEIL